MSPELLRPDKFGLKESRPTEQSDCYALAMVVYEVLSGQTPFASKTPSEVIQMVLKDKRPERPQIEEGEMLTDYIWEVLELCWKRQPDDRTNLEAVLTGLERNRFPSGSTSDADGDVEIDDNGQSGATAGESSTPSPLQPGLSPDHHRTLLDSPTGGRGLTVPSHNNSMTVVYSTLSAFILSKG